MLQAGKVENREDETVRLIILQHLSYVHLKLLRAVDRTTVKIVKSISL